MTRQRNVTKEETWNSTGRNFYRESKRGRRFELGRFNLNSGTWVIRVRSAIRIAACLAQRNCFGKCAKSERLRNAAFPKWTRHPRNVQSTFFPGFRGIPKLSSSSSSRGMPTHRDRGGSKSTEGEGIFVRSARNGDSSMALEGAEQTCRDAPSR